MGRIARRSDVNKLLTEVESSTIRWGDDVHVRRSGGGVVLQDDQPDEFWVRITEVGSGFYAGAYGWVMLIGRKGGGWADGPRKGTLTPAVRDPVWEAQLNDGLLVGTVTYVYREEVSGELRVQDQVCVG